MDLMMGDKIVMWDGRDATFIVIDEDSGWPIVEMFDTPGFYYIEAIDPVTIEGGM